MGVIAPIQPEISERIDQLEALAVATCPPVPIFMVHNFTPGMYIRTMIVPAGSLVTSKIHLTEHPYAMTRGRLRILNEETGEWTERVAPLMGVTKPGTRRVAIALEETHWTTYHVTSETDPEVIEDQIMLKHDAHLGGVKPLLIHTNMRELEALCPWQQ